MKKLVATLLTVAVAGGVLALAASGSTSKPGVTPTQGVAFPRPLPPDALAAYNYVGGIAGFDVAVIVRQDGRVTVDAGHGGALRRFTLSAAELKRLRGEVDRADLTHVKSGPPKGCCDQIDTYLFGDGVNVRNPPADTPGSALDKLESHLRALSTRRGLPSTGATIAGYVQVCGGPAPGRCFIETFGSCEQGVGCVNTHDVVVVDAAGHRVAKRKLRHGRFSVKVKPGAYTVKLIGVGSAAPHGKVMQKQRVTAVAGKTAHVKFFFGVP